MHQLLPAALRCCPLRLRSQRWQSEIRWAVILARSIPPLLAE